MNNDSLSRLYFAFTPEDMECLEAIKAKLRPIQGKVSNVVAIRYAMRLAAREGKR